MRCNIVECKQIIDDMVFSNPEVKELVGMGWCEPSSTLDFDYLIKGQVSITYHFKFFGSDYVTTTRLLNVDDGPFLFGWSGSDALTKAANHAIYEIVHKCSLKYKEEYERAIDEIYSEPYRSGRYNGD